MTDSSNPGVIVTLGPTTTPPQTLRDNGDSFERRAVTDYQLNLTLPNYEIFWRNHIVPATNRDADLGLRLGNSPVIDRMAQLSHGVMVSLVRAADLRKKIRSGDADALGDEGYSNCIYALQETGNALQKFGDLQRYAIDKDLDSVLPGSIKVWPVKERLDEMIAKREIVIAFRNSLVHNGQMLISHRTNAEGSIIPTVLSRDYFLSANSNNTFPTWADQKKWMKDNPSEVLDLADVCDSIYDETVALLNEAYGDVIAVLDPLLSDSTYLGLRGPAPTPPVAGSGHGAPVQPVRPSGVIPSPSGMA